MDPLFHSLETDSPFQHCCDCGCDLAATPVSYMIQKSYSGEECIFEFAICEACRDQISTEFSEKSREAMFDFFHDNVSIDKQMEEMEQALTPSERIASCLTCRTPRSQCPSYSYAGIFMRHIPVGGPFPIMICGQCENQLSDSLSKETRESWDRFLTENFPHPPSNAHDHPKMGRPILI